MSQENVDVVRRASETFDADLDGLLRLLDPAIEWERCNRAGSPSRPRRRQGGVRGNGVGVGATDAHRGGLRRHRRQGARDGHLSRSWPRQRNGSGAARIPHLDRPRRRHRPVSVVLSARRCPCRGLRRRMNTAAGARACTWAGAQGWPPRRLYGPALVGGEPLGELYRVVDAVHAVVQAGDAQP
jgi:hypothetical protein